MKQVECDVLVIGGGPAGGVTAITAKGYNPEKEVLLIREDKEQLVPCAIPYVFGNILGNTEKDIASCAPVENTGVKTMVGVVDEVDIENKKVYTKDEQISFDKLVLATGSVPFVHPSMGNATDIEGVFTVPKSKKMIDQLKTYVDTKQQVTIVGSGFIGVEIGLEFAKSGKEVTIIDAGGHILNTAFDAELASQAEELAKKAGITLELGNFVDSIKEENGIVTGVSLSGGKVIKSEVVVLATGYKPNTDLAKKAGLKLARYGGIWVDEYMRTRNHDIFAVGDCAARRDFITREPSKIMLASTSVAEARAAGSSLYKLKYIKGFNGTIAIFSTVIMGRSFASAGVTEVQAKMQNFDIITGTFEGMNRHPATIPDAVKQSVKLIAMNHSGRIIGGQIVGGPEVGELINIIGLLIEEKVSIYSLMSLQVATHPLLTAAPTNYPIIKAAEIIIKKMD
ncbi:FAD/NAD(P)-binding oxidoreductase [Sulfurovum sp.]|uniref:NAD(P)/FAD-dependent oxidoreductase n=1 Tax=Sulfurovum sp. TaxID=1969726 RepID=UPI0025CC4B4C|nr:FAD/NAD(P)-binding oxidoreductase [Sulfurovum sp.]